MKWRMKSVSLQATSNVAISSIAGTVFLNLMEWLIEDSGTTVLCASADLDTDNGMLALLGGGDDLIACRCSLDDMERFAIVLCFHAQGISKNENSKSFLKETATDCRDLILMLQGTASDKSSWLRNYLVIRNIVKPLLLSPKLLLKTSALTNPLASTVLLRRIQPQLEFTGLNMNFPWRFINEWESLETAMDILEGSYMSGNDTFDEAALCLTVGSVLLVHGVPVHASLPPDDVRLAMLLVSQNRHENSAGLQVIIKPIYVATSLKNGTRDEYLAKDSVMENRILVAVVLDHVCILKQMVSQELDSSTSGHVDPFGLVSMERAIREMRSQQVLLDVGRWISGAFEEIQSWLTSEKTMYVHELDSSVSRPRRNSDGGIWARMKRVGSDLSMRKSRSSSIDNAEIIQKAVSVDEHVSPFDRLDQMYSLSDSEFFRSLMTMYIGLNQRDMVHESKEFEKQNSLSNMSGLSAEMIERIQALSI